MDEPKKRMVSQTIAYSDGTETVITYTADEQALEAVEAKVVEDMQEVEETIPTKEATVEEGTAPEDSVEAEVVSE